MPMARRDLWDAIIGTVALTGLSGITAHDILSIKHPWLKLVNHL
jgi:hypothetical protein